MTPKSTLIGLTTAALVLTSLQSLQASGGAPVVQSLVAPTTPAASSPAAGPVVFGSTVPSSIEILAIDDKPTIEINGSGLLGVTGVKVDGIQLLTFPSQFQILSDSQMLFEMPLVSGLGPATIELQHAGGVTTGTITAIANAAPTIEMVNSSPAYLFQALGLELIVGGAPGDIVFVFGSPDNIPTKMFTLSDMDLFIGDNNRSLFILASPMLGASGYEKINIPMSGLSSGYPIFVQTLNLKIANNYALPFSGSNVQGGTVLF